MDLMQQIRTFIAQRREPKTKSSPDMERKKIRLGKDAVKGFDCCSLTLQPTDRPVITPQGWIFSKEAILTFILEKKKEYEKKLKKYESQLEQEKKDYLESANKDDEEARKKFEATEKNIITKRVEAFKQDGGYESISNTATGERKRHLPAFWMPSMGPQAKKTKLTQPDKTVYCPMSRQPIRMKDLIDVKWTLVKDPDNKASIIAKDERYQCAVTGDTLYNSTHCAVLRPTGDVVTMECVDKIIRKDMRHPLTGQSLKEKDIIPIQRGSTGFASANENLIAEKDSAAMSIG